MRKVAACLLLLAISAQADERILDFHSDILVMQDGWIEVTETIRVRSEGKRIRRGIYRDFPTKYEDKLGNAYVVEFSPVTVLRNDAREDFHAQDIRDGQRVYFGSADRFVNNGEHTYTFRYRASRMLGFFDSHDELYWNVTGTDWAFPIDSASATVAFEFDVPANALTVQGYTGPFGSNAIDYAASTDGAGRANIRTNNTLPPLNGLTVVVGWPKGYVEEPSDLRRAGWLLQDNISLLVALLGLAILLGYYIPVWRHFGRDPDEGVLVTRYEPPEHFSPASLRYVRQMYYDDKTMTAAVVNLGVKGYLRIDYEEGSAGFLGIGKDEGTYSLVKTRPGKDAPPMAVGEQELYDGLFSSGEVIVLENENHEVLGEAKSAHKQSLKSDYNKHYFQTNGLLNIPAILIVIISTVIAMLAGPSILVSLTIVAMIVTMGIFASIMNRPTIRGRALLDKILGFKDYLEIAEKDEMNLRNPPEKTPQLFEAYLPFALALDVDQLWAEKFATVLAAVQPTGEGAYQPHWYNGSFNTMDLSRATSKLSNNLNSAVTTSVAPPGSSSGGGGGGFSGGGGGGGGGGGW